MYKHLLANPKFKRRWPARAAWLLQRGSFKKLAHYSAGGLLILLIIAANIAIMPKAGAEGINAQHVLGEPDFTTGASNVSASSLTQPANSIFDSVHHRLFVADIDNSRVMVYDTTSGITDGMPAVHELGQTDFSGADPNQGLSGPTDSTLYYPSDLSYDSAHDRLFVSDSGNNRVMIYDLSGGITDGMPAVHELGQTDFSGSDCATGGNIGVCAGGAVTYDSVHQELFWGDVNNNRVMIYDLSGGITDGMPAVHELGQTDFSGIDANQGLENPTSSTLYNPQGGMSYDSTNSRLFVSDTSNNRVMIYDLSGGITDGMPAVHELGQTDFSGLDANQGLDNPTASSLYTPMGVSYDAAHDRLFVSDSSNNRVLAFSLSGGITDGMAASDVIGQQDFSHAESNNCYSDPSTPPTQSILCGPWGVTYISDNNTVWVADVGNNRLLSFGLGLAIATSMPDGSVNTAYSTNIGAEFGKQPYTYQITGSLPPGLSLNSSTGEISGTPTAIGSYNFSVLVTDSNDKFAQSVSGSLTITINGPGYAANGELGQPDFNGSTANHATVSANSVYGWGTIVDAADHLLFASDYGSNRILVYKLNSDGTPMDATADYTIGPDDFTSNGCQDLTVCFPSAIALDAVHHHLYVTQGYQGNYQVVIYDLNSDNTPDGNDPALSFGYSSSICYLDGYRNPTADNICIATGIALDTTNHLLYISDGGYSRIVGYQLDSNNMPIDTTADYVIGQSDFTHGDPDAGGDISASGLYQVKGLAIDTVHHILYAGDGGNGRVLGYALNSDDTPVDGTADYLLGQPNFTTDPNVLSGSQCHTNCTPNVTSLAIDSSQHILYVTSNSGGILGFDLNSDDTPVDAVADYVIGEPDSSTFMCDYPNGQYGDPGVTAAALCNPAGLSIDTTNHRLWVDDSNGGRILAYNLNSSDAPVDATADYLIGQPDFTSSYPNGVPPDANGLSGPTANVVDSATHHLYVADTNNNRVLIYNLDSNNHISGSSASYVLGQPDFKGVLCNQSTESMFEFGPSVTNVYDSSASTLCLPEGLALDTVHHVLYVSDNQNSRIVGYKLDANNVPLDGVADYLIGQPGFDSSVCDAPDGFDAGITASTLCFPSTLAIDSTNQVLYAIDDFSNRILAYNLDSSGAPVDDTADYVLANTDFNGDCDDDNVCGDLTTMALDTTKHLLYVGNAENIQEGNFTGQVIVYGLSDDNRPTTNTPDIVIGDLGDGDDEGEGEGCSLNGLPTDFDLCSADGLVVDSVNHRLFVYDDVNSRILVYNLDSNDLPIDQVADDVIGQQDYDSGDCNQDLEAPTQYTLCGIGHSFEGDPGIAYDPTSYMLFVPDAGNEYTTENNRVVSYELAHITTTSLPDGPTGSVYSQPIDQAGSQGAVSFSLQGGALPPGLSLDSASGLLSGTPTTGGTYNFTIGLADNNGQIGTFNDSKVLSLNITVPSTPPVTPPVTPPTTPPKKPVVPTTPVAPTVPPVTSPAAPTTPTTVEQPQTPAYQPNISVPTYTITKPPPHKSHAWSILKYIFPWLLFILLGLAVLRLSYQSYRERRLAGALNRQLALEKSLSEEKQNFITLSSHYLRTPMALISNGIDLMASLNGASPTTEELKTLAQRLNLGVNSLLYQSGNTVSGQTPPTGGQAAPLFGGLQSLAAGFVQISSMPAIVVATAGTLIIIGITDFILSKVDIYNVPLVTLLIQIAGVLLLGILLVAGLRSYSKRKQLREEAQALLDNQRRLDNARNQLSRASLDALLTPLNQLKTKLQPLMATNPKTAGPAMEGVRRLDSLLQKFIILTSLEGGTMTKIYQPTSLSGIIQNIQSRYSTALNDRHLTITTDLHADTLQQDPLLTTFVLDSLVNNAIKYSPPNQPITISSRDHGKSTEIHVSDNGPGIPKDKLNQLFQLFSRAENAAADFDHQGTGLSLYLDKLITDYLGGKINIHSSPQGTSASFNLPTSS